MQKFNQVCSKCMRPCAPWNQIDSVFYCYNCNPTISETSKDILSDLEISWVLAYECNFTQGLLQ
jgi:hypothetical protein